MIPLNRVPIWEEFHTSVYWRKPIVALELKPRRSYGQKLAEKDVRWRWMLRS